MPPGANSGLSGLVSANALLLGEPERLRRGVVLGVPARGLRRQPLGEVALVAAGPLGELRWRDRAAVAHRRVQPEPVTDQHRRGVEHRAQVARKAADELVQSVLVDCHRWPLLRCGWLSLSDDGDDAEGR